MSKIQEALRALRESGNQSPDSERRKSGDVSGTSPREKYRNKYERRNAMPSDAPELQATRRNGLVPLHRLEVDVNSLIRDGLMPSNEDKEIVAQQFRRIKRPIIRAAFDVDEILGENTNVVMMASALPGAGKSFCSFNLSQSIALERDVGAVLVDADVLKPGISRSLGLLDHVGLIDYLLDTSIRLEEILVQTDLNDMIVVPAGRKHAEATELLASKRMGELVASLSREYGRSAVIFDMPPLLLTSEAQVLSSQAGQIVVVIEARVSSQESVIRALGMLDRQKPINAILNKSRSAAGDGYQSDDYGYYSYPYEGNSNDVPA